VQIKKTFFINIVIAIIVASTVVIFSEKDFLNE